MLPRHEPRVKYTLNSRLKLLNMNVNVTIMMADLVDKLIFPVSTINKLKQQCRAYRISKSVRDSHVSGGVFIYVF